MNEEQAFLDEIARDPTDDATRLVYADWLEERGDPRAGYLRAEVALAAERPSRRKAIKPRRRLMDSRAGLDPAWLGRLEQPGVLRAAPVPYLMSWYAPEGEDIRENNFDYHSGTRYGELSPLPVEVFRGDLAWLDKPEGKRANKNLDFISRAAESLGLTLPPTYYRLFGDVSLIQRFRSCTDNFFWIPDDGLAPVPRAKGDYLLNFYSDSQGVFHWYLYLTPSGASCVVSSAKNWLEPEFEAEDEQIFFTAPSLEAFLYRNWIENEIWFSQSFDGKPLTPLQQSYVDFYKTK